MAASASRHICRVVAAEGTRTVVTRRAIITGSAVVFLGRDRRDLAPLLPARANRMTIGAIEALSTRMIAMAKHSFEDNPARRCSAIRSEFVTDIARADLFLGRVTGVTRRMRLDTDRDRLARTAHLVT